MPVRLCLSQFAVAVVLACDFSLILTRAAAVDPGGSPAILDLAHSPQQPRSGEPVTVTARLGNTNGLRALTLRVQVVEPGNYIRKTDAAYDGSWRDLPMYPAGPNGDTRGAERMFTVVVPPDIQKHRRLVRYFVHASSTNGAAVRLPQATNPCPNFAWFVYDGVPAWTGASQPGSTPLLTFSPQFLTSLPVYHLIARAGDVERSQWDAASNRKPFFGTLIYDGRVYDHIQFHNRGQASTYLAGKKKLVGFQV